MERIRAFRHSFVVLSFLVCVGACAERADEPVETSSSAVSVAQACASDCDCTFGNVCVNGQCSPDFGPLHECYCAERDCAPGETCDGICQPEPPITCWSNCDCSFGNLCSNGQCEPDFGPYHECYCTYRDCGVSQICRSGVCSDH